MGKDFLIRILGDASKGVSELDRFAKKAEDLTHLGQAGMVAGGLIAAGIGVAVAKYAEFDAAMSNVVATGDDAAASQDRLRQAAMDAGASTVFSATESANAIEELAKAGISAEDTLAGGLTGSLDLAAAGGLGVADAAATMATAMTQFSVEGSRATHVADLLAAGAGKAQGDVSDMSQALGQAGLVADATGLSIEETTGGLAAFASAGLLGSDAGTSFKSMLQRLTPQSAEAQRVMDELGISAYDAGGNFIGLADFAGNLQGALRSLTPEQRQAAMATIFGSDAVRAATILYNQGSAGIERWTESVNDQGYAAETAAKRLDNLQGDLEGLGGALDTALIQQGSGANDSLRALTTGATNAVTWFAELPAPVQQTGLYLGVAAAAVGLFGGAATIAVPKVLALKAATESTKFSLGGLALAAGGLTVGLAGVVAVVAAIAAEQAAAEQRTESYATTLEAGTNRITTATKEMVVANLAASKSVLWWSQDSAFDNARTLGVDLQDVKDATLGNVDALKRLDAATDLSNKTAYERAQMADELGISLYDLETASGQLRDSVRGESSSIEDAIRVNQQKNEVTEESTEVTKTSASAYLESADTISKLTDELDKLISSFNEANGTGQDAVTTNARWRESLGGITSEVQNQKDAYEQANGSLDGFSLTLDENTVAGSANAAMLAGVASDAQKAAEAQYEVDKSTVGAKAAADNYAATLANQRSAFEESARGAGFNADEVQRLADKVFALPPSRSIDILANTASAIADVERIFTLFDGRQVTLPVRGSADWQGPGYASGGEVRGAGTGTSDSIAAWLSDGEFVVRESVASKHKGFLNYLNSGGRLPAFKGGGMVGLAAANASPGVAMIPIASAPTVLEQSARQERQDDVRAAVEAVLARRPEGTRVYHFPEGVSAPQLVRAMDEDVDMNLRLG